MKYLPRKYQQFSTEVILKENTPGLLLDMGMGKTVSTLTAIEIILNELLEDGKVLIIAPKRVGENVWPDEIQKWDHTKGLTYSVAIGTEVQRKKALAAKADIYVINRENVPWIVGQYNSNWPFKIVVIDELSSFKSSDSIRFKELRRVRPYMHRVIGLTGTPASNGLMDLWSQMYLLDQGQRLGKFVTHYRDRFFEHIMHKKVLADGTVLRRGWHPRPGSEQLIYNLISDICVSMKSEDYLELPEIVNQDVHIRLTDKELQAYRDFEKERVLELKSRYEEIASELSGIEDPEDREERASQIIAVNAAALTGKLLQFANGAVYDENRVWHEFHRAKIEVLQEIIESANGQPVLVAYAFQHDQARLREALKQYNPGALNTPQDVKDWNEGKVQVMLTHPASAGHGLNLQFGGHIIVWFGLTWSLELYQQFVKRLARPGQKYPVVVKRLITLDTMDEEVMPVLDGKAKRQDALMYAVKARMDKY